MRFLLLLLLLLYVYSLWPLTSGFSLAARKSRRQEPCRGVMEGASGDLADVLVSDLQTPVFAYAMARLRVSDLDWLSVPLDTSATSVADDESGEEL